MYASAAGPLAVLAWRSRCPLPKFGRPSRRSSPRSISSLINGEKIQIHVRLRGGATRSLSVAKPLPIAQIRKTKSEVVAEIDKLLDQRGEDPDSCTPPRRGHSQS